MTSTGAVWVVRHSFNVSYIIFQSFGAFDGDGKEVSSFLIVSSLFNGLKVCGRSTVLRFRFREIEVTELAEVSVDDVVPLLDAVVTVDADVVSIWANC
jgi:hypothetical protein